MKDKRMIDFENDFTEEEEAVFNTKTETREELAEFRGEREKKETTNTRKAWGKVDPVIAPYLAQSLLDDTYREEDDPPEVRTSLMEETVVKQYKLGLPISEIQKKHGISSGTIYGILARKNIPLRSNVRRQSKAQERLSTMTELEKKSLVRDYKDGMSIQAIYEKYDINKHGAYLILDEAGVPRRHARGIGKGTDIANEMVKNIEDDNQAGKVYKADARLEDGILHIDVTMKKVIPVQAFQVHLNYEEDTEGEI